MGHRGRIRARIAGVALAAAVLLVLPDGAPASWDAWPGRWGRPLLPSLPPPLTPAFQGRYLHPFLSTPPSRRSF